MLTMDEESRRELIAYNDGAYGTIACRVPWYSRNFPTADFYRKFAWTVYRSSIKARHGMYDNVTWSRSSHRVLEALESVGVRVEITGTDNIRRLDSPCVFVGNHMSMLETIILPSMIQPIRDVTFVVKQSLMDYPVFRHIVRSRNPIAVSRANPRDDFKAVMKDGTERLQDGISIVVFPQTTRSTSFDPSEFNTIGVKLALRAKVPLIPIALKTDAWGNGKLFKDLGPIDATKTVHFAFGEPVYPEGRGDQQHQQVIDFIKRKLNDWVVQDNKGLS